MVKVRNYKPTGEGLDEPAVALFQEQWQLYRKFVDNNYFYHREVYGQPHRILVDEAVWPFRFLDIACGDARATVDALKGTRVAHYTGSTSPRRRWIWRARLLRRSPVLSRSTNAISLRRCAIGPNPWMSRGSVCRYTTSSPRQS